MKIKPLLKYFSLLRFKQFALGMHLSSERLGNCREYYILFSLGFWQLSVGFERWN